MAHKPKILLIEDDDVVFEYFNILLGDKVQLLYSSDGEDFMSLLKQNSVDAVFVDLNLPTISGHYIIEKIKEYDEDIPCVVISSTDRIQDAIKAFRLGIVDFLTKPIDEDHLKRALDQCLKQKSMVRTVQNVTSVNAGKFETDLIVGNAQGVLELKEQIKQLAGSTIDTLVLGESGTGKELVAKSLWLQEGHKKRPYVTLNCSAIPKELMESVLFGHEKGSFTGAVKKQLGKFELANGGDIFLDEIGTLPMDLQAKLLRVLQEREIEPVGLGLTKKLDFRVIAATNEDLVEMVKEKEFRKDLYYRLNKVILRIPPLRERVNDIPDLIEFFLKKHSRNNLVKSMSAKAIDTMVNHSWPGNVRELENVMENLIITSRGGEITEKDVSRFNFLADPFDEFSGEPSNTSSGNAFSINLDDSPTLDQAVRELEKTLISRALDHSETKLEAASKLGVDRKTLSRKLKLYELE